MAGGRLGGLNETQVDHLGDVGAHLGMTFQLVDDKLDLCGDPQETGKDTCLDLREGKLTWPMILAAERSPDLLLRLRPVAESVEEPDPAEVLALVEAIRKTGAIEDTHAEATKFADLAEDALDKLPNGRAHDALRAVIRTALERSR
jgi:octaprenyl-diphosphate synthase